MVVLAAALALSTILPVALQAEPAPPKVAVPSADEDNDKDQPRPLVQPTTPTKVPAAKAKRWVDWQIGNVDSRYRRIETSAGMTTSDHLQHRQAFKAGFKFDKSGRYSVQTFAGTGNSFTGSWDNLGPGTGAKNWDFSIRQLYLQAQPVRGIEGQWGGMSIARGEQTEVTSFDNDNFIVAGRVSVRRPEDLYLDELSVTAGYVGDTSTPNVFRRFDRWDEHNYTQVLAVRKFGRNVSLSADWTDLDEISTLRQAVRVATRQWLPIDAIRFENYQRVEGKRGYGFSVSTEKAVHPRVVLTGGYADIDENNGSLNGDRYGRGKRVFVEPRIAILPELIASVFYGQAFGNDFPVNNKHRFEIVVSYSVLWALPRGGAW
jgi:hypothetical protein